MDIIGKFKNSAWIKKAEDYVKNPERLKGLIAKCGTYIGKEGLSSVKENLLLLISYVKDIAVGKYKDYDVANLAIIVAALLYVVSPIDLIPDFLPVGFADDATIVMWAISEMKNELDKYKQFKSQ